jgi:hypothetical protein
MTGTLEDDEPAAPKDLFFDPECSSQSRQAKTASRAFLEAFMAAEASIAPRTRQRRANDASVLEQQLSAILGNLVRATKRKKPTPVAVSQSNSVLGRKGTHPVLNDKLPTVLNTLELGGFIHLQKGSVTAGKMTTFEPAAKAIELIDQYGLTASHFKLKDRHPIILRATKTAEEKRRKKPGKELPLPDTDEVRRMAQEVNTFNAYLQKQVIEYVGDRDDIDDERLSVYRVFNNGSLAEGGRLYGGFWYQLSGAKTDGQPDEREKLICINGEHLTGLDYGQMAVRILYSFAGVQMTLKDAYILPGWANSREGMKKLINAMINSPTGEPEAIKGLFRDHLGSSVKQLTKEATASIYEHHAPIINYMFGTMGYKVTYEESNHLIRLLLKLVDLDIPALPVHDCLYVRLSDEDRVRALMTSTFEDHFKVTIDVKNNTH